MIKNENKNPVYLENGRIKAPECANGNGYIDDFSNGISPQRWRISNRKWGPLTDYQLYGGWYITFKRTGALFNRQAIIRGSIGVGSAAWSR